MASTDEVEARLHREANQRGVSKLCIAVDEIVMLHYDVEEGQDHCEELLAHTSELESQVASLKAVIKSWSKLVDALRAKLKRQEARHKNKEDLHGKEVADAFNAGRGNNPSSYFEDRMSKDDLPF